MRSSLPARVQVVEVGPRDGLQNDEKPVSTEQKAAFVAALVDAGLTAIEVTSFVRTIAVPQLADAAELVPRLPAAGGVTFSALVPNMTGLRRALRAGVPRIAVFTAASDTFARRNIRMSVETSLTRFADVVEAALEHGVTVRGYVSTCFVCPYEGEIGKTRVREITERLLEMGADEVAISDTIGAAAPGDIHDTVGHVLERVPRERLALHLHDTCGTALANVYAGLELGITTFDASAGGLGGCPYAPGAAGNLATEDLVYMLDRLGIETGVDLEAVFAASRLVAGALGRTLPGRQYQRLLAAHGVPRAGIDLMRIHRYDLVDSTNEEAKRLLAAGRVEGCAGIVARGQTSGRGTRGRAWASPRDAGVYLSLVETGLGPVLPGAGVLTLAAGVACAEAVADVAGVAVRLKPVNDLCAGAGKLGGILAEAIVEAGRLDAAVIGVGINVRRAERPVGAASLAPVCLEELLEPAEFARLSTGVLVDALFERLSAWNRIVAGGAVDAVRRAWIARSAPGTTLPAAEACS